MLASNQLSRSACCAGCLADASAAPCHPAEPRWLRMTAILAGLAAAGGVAYLVLRARPPRVYADPRRDRHPTVEIPFPEETMEEVVWERRR